MTSKRSHSRAMMTGAVLVLTIGSAIGYAFNSSMGSDWYAALTKPPLTPPGPVFGPVWAALYLMIGAAGGRIWNESFGRARFWYVLQLALNFLWSPVFFGLQQPDQALGVIAGMVVAAVVATIRMGAVSRLAAWLMVPYLVWICFAAILNLRIWQLNGG